MAGSTVSVLVPVDRGSPPASGTRETIERYLATTGFTFEVLVLEDDCYGAAIRRGVADARGNVIVIVDPSLPYPVTAIGDAVAMIESGTTDVVFAAPHDGRGEPSSVVRWLLVPYLPDTSVRLKAFSSPSAKLVAAETKLVSNECDLEIGFLVNKYGFRVEHLHVEVAGTAVRHT